MMKRKIYKSSYIFDENIYLAPRLAFDLLKRLNIFNNVVLHYFRVKFDKLNLTKFEKNAFEIFKDKTRDDNTFIYFPSIKSISEILGIYDLDFFQYPVELEYNSINCSFTIFMDNLQDGNINNNFRENNIYFSVGIYEGLIEIKMNKKFYDERKRELDLLIEEWESTLSNLKIRKTVK